MPAGAARAPVVLIIFNRPDLTALAFDAIRLARPERLLVIADAPRPGRPGEAAACAQARAVSEEVDWPCLVERNYASAHMGLRRRVSSGLDWVFSMFETAVILEDDCVAHPTFFPFCDELLARYRDDARIMAVSGNNFLWGKRRTEYSYYFSRYYHIWGWATWRRAWRFYDDAMTRWNEVRDGDWLCDILADKGAARRWAEGFQRAFKNRMDTWAFRWVLSCWTQSGLSIAPAANLVTNVGFRPDATHTKWPTRQGGVPAQAMAFPLRHPSFIIRDAEADAIVQRTFFDPPCFCRRCWSRARSLAGRLVRKCL